MKKNNKGFTLAELLIVVAIIAVLVAVAIPTFTTQLEKSKQAVDEANCRSAYAQAVAAYLTNDENLKGKEIEIGGAKYSWNTDANGKTTVTGTSGMKSSHYSAGIVYDGTSFTVKS